MELCAFILEMILLLACASVCAVAIELPPSPQALHGHSPCQRVGDVAAATATATLPHVGPLPEIRRAIDVAAQAATAVAAEAVNEIRPLSKRSLSGRASERMGLIKICQAMVRWARRAGRGRVFNAAARRIARGGSRSR